MQYNKNINQLKNRAGNCFILLEHFKYISLRKSCYYLLFLIDDSHIHTHTYIYNYMIKTSEKMDKSDTYKGFSSDISFFIQRIYEWSLIYPSFCLFLSSCQIHHNMCECTAGIAYPFVEWKVFPDF